MLNIIVLGVGWTAIAATYYFETDVKNFASGLFILSYIVSEGLECRRRCFRLS